MPTRNETVKPAADKKSAATEAKPKTNKMSKATESAKQAEAPAAVDTTKKSALRKKIEGFFEKTGHLENMEEYAERGMPMDGQPTQVAFIAFKDGKQGAAMALYDIMQKGELVGYSVEIAAKEDVLIIYKG